MKKNDTSVIYWDTSVVVSTLFKDNHSEVALQYASINGIHLISSLVLAETYAVINRIRREILIPDVLVEAAIEAFESGPWRQIKSSPNDKIMKAMAEKWSLRGADLWHLTTAKTLKQDLPELVMVTFDDRLLLAASGEGLAL